MREPMSTIRVQRLIDIWFTAVHDGPVKPNGPAWRTARAEADLSSKEAAKCLSLEQRSLLNIESGQPRAVVSERLARRAARFYGVPLETLVAGSGEGVPDEPPSKEQERETNTGPGRDGGSGTSPGKGSKGPKRAKPVAA